MSADGPVGRREVAVRVFAAEYDDATLEYSESDEERAPNYVVTPTGARVNRLFAVGVLTEVEPVSDDVLRGRVVDPTGAFVVYAGQYQPDAKTALERAEPPEFVAVTGKARTFEPDDADRVYTSIRPESVNTVDAATRDRWTVQTAEHTLDRVSTMAAARERDERGDALREVLLDAGVPAALAAGIPRAIDHYGTTGAYLAAVKELAVQAAEVVAGEREEAEPLSIAPGEGGAVEADLAADVSIEAEAAAAAGAVAAEGGGPTTVETADATGGEEPNDSVESAAAVDEGGPDEGATADTREPADDAEPEATAEAAAGGSTDDDELGDFDDFGADDGVDAEGTDELYELDEDERAAVEEEYGTEFSTGSEVESPGEADIEVPDPDEAGAPEAGGADTDGAEDTEDAGEEPSGPDEGEAPEEDVGTDEAGEVDLVDAVVATMDDHDDGDGADREAVVASVADEHGVDEAAIDEAIQEALMAGRCYEPDDGRLKAI